MSASMVVVFAERGDWEDYVLEPLAVCREEDAPIMCMRAAEGFIPRASEKSYGLYNYHLRWLRSGDEPRCTFLNDRYNSVGVEIFPHGSVVMVAVDKKGDGIPRDVAHEMDWVVTWKRVPLLEVV